MIYIVSAMSKWKMLDENVSDYQSIKQSLNEIITNDVYPTMLVYNKEQLITYVYHLKEDKIYIGYSFTYKLNSITDKNIAILKNGVQNALTFIADAIGY